jgi:hypothetical protein
VTRLAAALMGHLAAGRGSWLSGREGRWPGGTRRSRSTCAGSWTSSTWWSTGAATGSGWPTNSCTTARAPTVSRSSPVSDVTLRRRAVGVRVASSRGEVGTKPVGSRREAVAGHLARNPPRNRLARGPGHDPRQKGP